MILGVLAFVGITYLFIVPTVVADRYLNQLNPAITQTKNNFKAVSSSSSVAIFEDPGIKMEDRPAIIKRSLERVQKAQTSLDNLQNANKLTTLPGNGFAGAYHRAIVRQGRIDNIIRQSQQVLSDYTATLHYTSAYTEARAYLESRLLALNQVHDFNKLMGQGGEMTATGAELELHRQKLAQQKPPPGFEPIHSDSLQTLDNAATQFNRLGAGLNHSSNEETYGAIKVLEQITLKHEVEDKEMMTNLAQKSPSLLQLADLSEKIEFAQQL